MFLIVLAAAVVALFAAPAMAEPQFDKANQAALRAIQACSAEPVKVLAESTNTILVYRIRAEVLDCLGLKPGIFASPYGDEACAEDCSPMPWMAVKTKSAAAIVSAAGSDWGASAVIRVRPDIFIVAVEMSTHTRDYLVRLDTDEARYLTDGKVEVKDAEKFIFVTRGRKSYFRAFGAFWYDALIDGDGHILDVLPENGTMCFPHDEAVRRTYLDLSRVKRETICFIW